MRHATISRKFLFELNARFAAGRRSLSKHFEDGLFLFGTIFCSQFDLQVELQFRSAHRGEVLAFSSINERPSSRVRRGVLSWAEAFAVSMETSLGRLARPEIAEDGCAATRCWGSPKRAAIVWFICNRFKLVRPAR